MGTRRERRFDGPAYETVSDATKRHGKMAGCEAGRMVDNIATIRYFAVRIPRGAEEEGFSPPVDVLETNNWVA